jgi:hypothetical protein
MLCNVNGESYIQFGVSIERCEVRGARCEVREVLRV